MVLQVRYTLWFGVRPKRRDGWGRLAVVTAVGGMHPARESIGAAGCRELVADTSYCIRYEYIVMTSKQLTVFGLLQQRPWQVPAHDTDT